MRFQLFKQWTKWRTYDNDIWITGDEFTIETRLFVHNLTNWKEDQEIIKDGFKDFLSRITRDNRAEVKPSRIRIDIFPPPKKIVFGDFMEQDGILMDVAFHVDESKLEKLNKTAFFNVNYFVTQLNTMIDLCDIKLDWCNKHGMKVMNATKLVIKKDSGSMVNL